MKSTLGANHSFVRALFPRLVSFFAHDSSRLFPEVRLRRVWAANVIVMLLDMRAS